MMLPGNMRREESMLSQFSRRAAKRLHTATHFRCLDSIRNRQVYRDLSTKSIILVPILFFRFFVRDQDSLPSSRVSVFFQFTGFVCIPVAITSQISVDASFSFSNMTELE